MKAEQSRTGQQARAVVVRRGVKGNGAVFACLLGKHRGQAPRPLPETGARRGFLRKQELTFPSDDGRD